MNFLILGDYASTRMQKNIHSNLSNCNLCFPIHLAVAL